MEAGPSREEQQELAFWNSTMSGAALNSTTLLESMVNQNGTDTVQAYDTDLGFGGKDWLALFFMTFGKDLFLPGGSPTVTGQLTKILPLLFFPFSPTRRLGPSVHFRSRVLESETMGGVD